MRCQHKFRLLQLGRKSSSASGKQLSFRPLRGAYDERLGSVDKLLQVSIVRGEIICTDVLFHFFKANVSHIFLRLGAGNLAQNECLGA